MTDAARIAEGLTEAQLKEVRSLSEHPVDKSIKWFVRIGYDLERLGLAEPTVFMDRIRLTPLGLAVRDHLLKQERKDD